MKRVKISIFNNDYIIKTDADEEYVRDIAQYLENKVREASTDADPIAVNRPFLLATLKITDDYFRLKREFEEFKNSAEERSRKLVEMLDKSFNSDETLEPFNKQVEEKEDKQEGEEFIK